jgi:16S rRNA processing protein RimM
LSERPRPTNLLEVGRVAKPHGLRGEVVVALTSDREERTSPGTVLWTDAGPLVVAASRPHHGRWLVSFEGTFDRGQAEALAGTTLYAEPLHDPDALWVHELVGSSVVELDGTPRGEVVAVMANPAHDLLELDNGALVPVVFVQSAAHGVVVIDPPDGLFEAFE